MNIDELVDQLIQEEWQRDIEDALKDILPHVSNSDEALGALEQVMGELTDYQKQFALELIDKSEQ